MKLYSDLIVEASSSLVFTSITDKKHNIEIAQHDVNDTLADKIGRKSGKYISLFLNDDTKDEAVIQVLHDSIKKLCKFLNCTLERTLVVGLGNSDYIVDSLGELVTKKLNVKEDELMCIAPDINMKTGIESSFLTKCLCKNIRPSCCIVIDSIATTSKRRLANCFQLTSARIMPGGGVSSKKKVFIDKSYLDCPIIAIGVPLIVSTPFGLLMPFDIEDVIKKASDNISEAINSFF